MHAAGQPLVEPRARFGSAPAASAIAEGLQHIYDVQMKTKALEKLVKTYALSLPEATEDHPWGETVAKVHGKVFVFMGKPQDETKTYGFSVKLPESAVAVLEAPNAEPTGYGLGKSGWVSITFADGDEVDAGWVKSLVLESWRAVAPKRLSKAFDS